MITVQHWLFNYYRRLKRYSIIQLILIVTLLVGLAVLYDIFDRNNKVVLNEISQIKIQLNKIEKSLHYMVLFVDSMEEKEVDKTVRAKSEEDMRNNGDSIIVENNEHVAWEFIERVANAVTLYGAAFPPEYEKLFNSACGNYFKNLNVVSEKKSINSCVSDEDFNRKDVVLFDTSSSKLTNGAINKLMNVLLKIKELNINKVYVYGYADKTGDISFNKKLSRGRAEAVATYLKQYAKASRFQIIIDAFGSDNTPVPTPEGMSEPLNRSVSVSLRK